MAARIKGKAVEEFDNSINSINNCKQSDVVHLLM